MKKILIAAIMVLFLSGCYGGGFAGGFSRGLVKGHNPHYYMVEDHRGKLHQYNVESELSNQSWILQQQLDLQRKEHHELERQRLLIPIEPRRYNPTGFVFLPSKIEPRRYNPTGFPRKGLGILDY